MKRLFAFLVLACGLAFGQQDIKISQIGPYLDIARNVNWTAAGIGGLKNNYILTPSSPNTGYCLQFSSTDSLSHTATFSVAVTQDQNINTYIGQSASWTTIISNASVSITGTAPQTYFVPSTGAARTAFLITASTGSGTGTVVLSQVSQPCSPSTASAAQTNSINNACPKTANSRTISGASTTTLVAAPAAGQFVHVCSFMVSGNPASSGEVIFTTGTAGTCAVPGTTLWNIYQSSQTQYMLTNNGQIFQTDVAAQPLCYINATTGSAASEVSVAYAVF